VENLDAQDDEKLVTAAAGGSCDAFAALTARHYGMVYAIGCARLGDADMAEDLAQEVFLRAFLHIGKLEHGAHFAAWAARIARNLATDWGRQRAGERQRLVPKVLGESDPMTETPDRRSKDPREEIDAARLRQALRIALGELPAEDREIVLLHYAHGMSHREIAERLGMARTSVSYRLTRSLGRFRESLGGYPGAQVARAVRLPSQAVARATAVIVAASALSAGSRAALAAQSAAVVGKGAVGGSTWFPLLKTTKAATFAGGIIMAKKTIAVLGLAGLALWGGHYALKGGTAPAAAPSGAVIVTVTPSSSNTGQTELSPNRGAFRALGARPFEVVGMLFNATPGRITVAPDVPQVPVDVQATSANLRGDAFLAALHEEVPKQLGVRVTTEKRDADALVLTAPGGSAPPGMRPSTSRTMTQGTPGGMVATGALAEQVARRMEFVLHKPVILETSLPGKYDFTLSWNPVDPNSIIAAAQQLGFQVTPTRRPVETLSIEKVR
jgi:RNA polymerase sigma-70 factor, ECF subfamily